MLVLFVKAYLLSIVLRAELLMMPPRCTNGTALLLAGERLVFDDASCGSRLCLTVALVRVSKLEYFADYGSTDD